VSVETDDRLPHNDDQRGERFATAQAYPRTAPDTSCVYNGNLPQGQLKTTPNHALASAKKDVRLPRNDDQ